MEPPNSWKHRAQPTRPLHHGWSPSQSRAASCNPSGCDPLAVVCGNARLWWKLGYSLRHQSSTWRTLPKVSTETLTNNSCWPGPMCSGRLRARTRHQQSPQPAPQVVSRQQQDLPALKDPVLQTLLLPSWSKALPLQSGPVGEMLCD